ncbi:MAG: response regulator transcription factor [Gemmatimonadetes bacterium]|nr:response regulator transcription factor [Gemmatimonadota bacterium]
MARILVVEDEPSIALGLEDDLKLEGYDVEVARDGEAALDRLRRDTFDVIVLDVLLPRKDGFQVCRELRRGGVTTPILILTAKAQEAEKVMGLELGADDYVTKPFSPAELRARIKALLRRSAGAGVSAYRFGDVEADFQRFELQRGGRPVPVTPIELKLLAAFVRRRGQVLSRAALKDEVWGKDTFMTDRVIDTHIANLRKKIEPEPSDPRYVVSVRGVGYRFDG